MATSTACLRQVDVEVPAGEVEREFTRVAQGIQKRARIPGFRPGKAPLSLVKQHFAERIREEALEALVPAHLRAAFEREQLEPVSTPTLKGLDYQPGAALKFQASFEVMPAFELGEYGSIRVPMPPLEVSDEEIEAGLLRLRERHSTTQDSDAPEVAEGLVALVEARNLSQENATPQEVAIEVGSDNTLPEFNAALKGMKPGEERELEVNYPADFPEPAVAGKTVRYHLKLNRIQQKTLPGLEDAAITETLGTTTAAEARQWMAERLRAEHLHEARHTVEEKAIAELMQQAQFEVPRALVDQRIEDKIERNLRGLAQQGVNLRKLEVDWSKLRDRHQPDAEREVRAGLLLDKLAEREHLAATEADVEEEIRRAAVELRQSPDVVRARLKDNGARERIEARIRQEKAMNWLLDSATEGGFSRAAAVKEQNNS